LRFSVRRPSFLLSSKPLKMSMSGSRAKSVTAHLQDESFEPLHPSHLYLHHKDQINHQLEDLVGASPSAVRRISPARPGSRDPGVGSMLNGSCDKRRMSEYERWWYTERDRIVAHLEGKGESPSHQRACSVDVATATDSPTRAMVATPGNSPSATRTRSPAASARSPYAGGTCAGQFVNHYHEPILQVSTSAGTRELQQSISRNPPAADGTAYSGLTSYEQWWYAERDRIASQVADKQASVKRV
jgi:hypothetical protein